MKVSFRINILYFSLFIYAGSCWFGHFSTTFRRFLLSAAYFSPLILHFNWGLHFSFDHRTFGLTFTFPSWNQCSIQPWTSEICRSYPFICSMEYYILDKCCKLPQVHTSRRCALCGSTVSPDLNFANRFHILFFILVSLLIFSLSICLCLLCDKWLADIHVSATA